MSRQVIPAEFNVSERIFFIFDWRQSVYVGVGVALAALSMQILGGLPYNIGLYVAAGCIALGVAGATFRPHDRGLMDWVIAALRFYRRPQRYLWGPNSEVEMAEEQPVLITGDRRTPTGRRD